MRHGIVSTATIDQNDFVPVGAQRLQIVELPPTFLIMFAMEPRLPMP